MSEITVITNGHPRDLLSSTDVGDKIRNTQFEMQVGGQMPKKYRIKKSYGKWSSSTEVEGPNDLPKGSRTVSVYHPSTKETFDIPADYLVAKRYR